MTSTSSHRPSGFGRSRTTNKLSAYMINFELSVGDTWHVFHVCTCSKGKGVGLVHCILDPACISHAESGRLGWLWHGMAYMSMLRTRNAHRLTYAIVLIDAHLRRWTKKILSLSYSRLMRRFTKRQRLLEHKDRVYQMSLQRYFWSL